MSENSVLTVEDLTVEFPKANGEVHTVVDKVCFSFSQGDVLGLVGESGSGKTMVALSIMGLNPAPGRITAGRVLLKGRDVLRMSEQELRAIRGNDVGIVFQDPLSAFNPVKPVAAPLIQSAMRHGKSRRREAVKRSIAAMEAVGIANAAERIHSYPHEFSGGQRQRIMIALAIMNDPSVIIADEPTTALDTTVQAQILDLLKSRVKQSGLLLITHDLGVAAEICGKIAVMRRGKIVEFGTVDQILTQPEDPYTKRLIAAVPTFKKGRGIDLSPSQPRSAQGLLEVRHLTVTFRVGRHSLKAVDNVNLTVQKGQSLGIVGESGSGKSTLAKTILRIIKPSDGEILFDGQDIHQSSGQELRAIRGRMQLVFQDPYASLDPRWPVKRIVSEPLIAQGQVSRTEIDKRVNEVMAQVELPPDSVERLPAEFSGGERQRICLARALILRPELLIADEPVSSLDVTIQKQIVELLKTFQQESGISIILIAHDLPLVYQMTDQVVVLYLGQVVEQGPTEKVLSTPAHPYTVALLSASLTPDPRADRHRIVLPGDPPSALNPPSGCYFHPRCPIAKPNCRVEKPRLSEISTDVSVACHYPGELRA